MRPIDADKTHAVLMNIANHLVEDGNSKQGAAFAIAAETVAKQPTIDPESLRPQGEWIDKPTGRYGAWQSWYSVCGKHSGIGGIESNRHKPYCPNSGARMNPYPSASVQNADLHGHTSPKGKASGDEKGAGENDTRKNY